MKENTAKNLVSGGFTFFIALLFTVGFERLGNLRFININNNSISTVDNWMRGFLTLMGLILILFFIGAIGAIVIWFFKEVKKAI
jgi:hypothetical protein